jgi:adenylate cyclase
MNAEGVLAETKDVAVLFSDIRGFTSVTERSEASAVVQMLNLYFSEWDRVCRLHGGIIDKFMGDGVMIIFEPREGGEPAQDAVQCARAMLTGLGELKARVADGRLPVLAGIGVGIASGPVILGNIGSTQRRNYTAIGDTVNIAARLESARKEYGRTLIVSGPVRDVLDEELRSTFTFLGEAALKGKTGSLPIFGASPGEGRPAPADTPPPG